MRRTSRCRMLKAAVVVSASALTVAATAVHGVAATASAPPSAGVAVALTPSSQDVFYVGAQNHLYESWFTGGSWRVGADVTAGFASQAAPESGPGAAATPDGSTVVLFWQGDGGSLVEAWQVGNTWHGPVDIGRTYLNGQATLASAPSVAVAPDGTQLVFWQSTDDTLNEAWYTAGSWHGPQRVIEQGGGYLLASSPSVSVAPDGTEAVFWQGMGNNHLMEVWKTSGVWHGPSDKTNFDLGGADLLASSPSTAETPDGSTQLVFWQTAGGHLAEAWYAGGAWHGPVDWTAGAFNGAAPLSSAAAAAVTPDGSTQTVFWQSGNQQVFEGWYSGQWHGPLGGLG